MNETILEMKDISKSFPGVKALSNAKLTVKSGTVHALMGENGAGKSTLMKCLFGLYTPDSGKIILDGKEVSFKNAKEALENGVAMVHQELNQALKRSVSDNLWLGRYPTSLKSVVMEKRMYRKSMELFEKLKVMIDPNRIVSTLPISKRQMIEIAKAVSYNAKVIVFDEPTSSLNEQEVKQLFEIIRMLKNEGCGIIYISHKMAEILEISDEVTVMRDGMWIATKKASDLTTEEIIKLMVGRELKNQFPPKTNTPEEKIFSVENLTGEHSKLKDISFDLRRGEILGLAGLDGSGRTELLESIFGISEIKSGKFFMNGKRISNPNPRKSIRNGFALLTEERRSTGIFGVLNIRENTVISSLKNHLRFGYLSSSSMQADTKWAIENLRTKTSSQGTKISTLSGGNQQKVILGRWLLTNPQILLLDEPTRGIDVGAKYEIYQLIINMANEGKSIIVASSEMPELMGLCDRILVLSGGRIAGEVAPDTATQEEIMTLAAKFV